MHVRDQLLEAAVKVFADSGFRGSTTRRIAQEAGVNEVTLFRHFGSKEGLILEAVVRAVTRLRDETVLPETPVDPVQELLGWAKRHHEFVVRHHRLIKAVMADAQNHPNMACVGERLGATIELSLRAYLGRLQDGGQCAPDVDVTVAASVLNGVIFSDAMGRGVHPACSPFPADEAPARYVSFFLRALSVRDALPSVVSPVPDHVTHHG